MTNLTNIGDRSAGCFDEFNARLAEIKKLVATEDIDLHSEDSCRQSGENRIVTNIAAAIEKQKSNHAPRPS